MELEKDKKKMGAEQLKKHDSVQTGADIINYLLKTLDLPRKQSLAELLEINIRTLDNWATLSAQKLDKNKQSLKALFELVNKMEGQNIPASAMLKLLKGQLTEKSTSPMLIQIIVQDPMNPLLDYTSDKVVQEFKEKYYDKVSSDEIEQMKKTYKLSDDQRKQILKKATRR